MSVLVVVRFQGDTSTFRQALQDRADEFVAIGERAKAAGERSTTGLASATDSLL